MGNAWALGIVLGGILGGATEREDDVVTVLIRTVPVSARVHVDGQLRCARTPCEVRVAPGSHTLVADGGPCHQGVGSTVDIPGEGAEVEIHLRPRESAEGAGRPSCPEKVPPQTSSRHREIERDPDEDAPPSGRTEDALVQGETSLRWALLALHGLGCLFAWR